MPAREYTESRVIADSRQYSIDRGIAVGRLAVETADPYAGYLVYDTFTDDDDVAIANHTPEKDNEGGGWSVINGTAAEFKISSNQLLINLNTVAGSGWSLAVIDSGQGDCKITGSIILAGSNPAIMFRATDDDNMWIMNFGVTANLLRLFKRDAAAQTTEDSTAVTYTAGDVIEFEITLSGNSITAKDVTNNKTVTTSDAFNNTETTHGFGENSGGLLVKVDDFFVQ